MKLAIIITNWVKYFSQNGVDKENTPLKWGLYVAKLM